VTAPCCSKCGLTVTYMDGYPQPEDGMPDGWIRDGRSGALVCVRCRRDRVARAAEAKAAREGLSGWRQKRAGTVALVALELERDPTATNAVIAKRLGIASAAAVRKLRTEAEAA
jgi:hypothetical protein